MTTIQVFHDGQKVGNAIATGERFGFQYDDGWLQTRGFPISVRLPLTSKTYKPEVAHPFFANLLPEGPARIAICARLGISVENDVALLEALGTDTAGALQFPVELERDIIPRQPIDLTELRRWADGEPTIPAGALPRLSLAGAQHKVSVVVEGDTFFTPASDEASTHILKFNADRFKHLALNEYFSNRFAKALGLDVVNCSIQTVEDVSYLVVERYDRVPTESRMVRLHQEDFCQILGVLPSRKYESEGGPSLSNVVSAIRRFSSRPAADLLQLSRWIVFNAIAGNADAHAKNIALLYRPSGLSLAPFYDLVCTRAYPALSPDLAMAIGGERDPDRLTSDRWKRFSEETRIKGIAEIAGSMVERAPAALQEVVALFEKQGSAVPLDLPRVIQKRIRGLSSNL